MPEAAGQDFRFRLIERAPVRPDEPKPHLRIHCTNVFVSDLERSRRFYVEQLGFQVVYEAELSSGEKWLAVAPPDGTAVLAIVVPPKDSSERRLIGRDRLVTFGTTDVAANYAEWAANGVQFIDEPGAAAWGGLSAHFADPDGNTFSLVSHELFTSALEKQRLMAAEKMQAERELRQQIEIARQVQLRLLPQEQPPLPRLSYAGLCLPARSIGGDYYDFLTLDEGRTAFVLGDISGKGIGAALLMAHLQATVRGQLSLAREGPRQFLAQVNQLFRANTSDNSFATLLYLDYDARSGRFQYANCGHPAPVLVTHAGEVQRLDPTATVIGLFDGWQTTVGEMQISGGDVLVLFSDGVTEQPNASDEEFGEERLVQTILRQRRQPVELLLQSIVDEVRTFSVERQSDDLTLIVAKGL